MTWFIKDVVPASEFPDFIPHKNDMVGEPVSAPASDEIRQNDAGPAGADRRDVAPETRREGLAEARSKQRFARLMRACFRRK